MTVLRVDLNTFSDNLRAIAARTAPAAHMLVVKDDAYAHGLEPIVRRAWAEGVGWFGAFDVHTGAAVRDVLGAAARVFVWVVGTFAEASLAVEHDLDIGVGDAVLLDEVARAAHAAGARARVHLKVDTGLHRNGVRPEEWPAFIAQALEAERRGAIEVVGVWSHLAEASDDEDDAARAIFDAAWDAARAAGLRPTVRHLAASAAAFARPEFRYDLVRIGAFAYGIRPAGGPGDAELGIRPIALLQTEVVGQDGDSAVVGIGSLDGLMSGVGGRTTVATAHGRRPLTAVGRHTSTVGDWPDARVGEVVTVWGPPDSRAPSPTDLAEAIGTIGEEIVLRVSPGIRRELR